jgi:hypothetical protein
MTIACIGLDLDGIFRISASKKELDRVQLLIDEGTVVDFNHVSSDPHLAAGLLKKFFRDLPGKIFVSL